MLAGPCSCQLLKTKAGDAWHGLEDVKRSSYTCRERKKVETAEAKAKEKEEKEKQVGILEQLSGEPASQPTALLNQSGSVGLLPA